MRNSAGAVIPMQLNTTKLKCVWPGTPDFEAVFSATAFTPFSEDVLRFLQGLSACLLRAPAAKPYPDLITFAFWCRKASLLALKAEYASAHPRLGRGVVFHIAPANVPLNFAYSLAVGLLAGNANIVRLPTREFPQVQILCAALGELLAQAEFSALAHHVVLLRYDHDEALTAYFSHHADVRVIWGGDGTIQEIRRAPLSARAFDLTFADRYSLCAIQADEYLKEEDPERVAQGFYNDTYLFDQNACTSPHLIVWLGGDEQITAAKQRFWGTLHKIVKEKYVLQPVWAVDKYVAACESALKQVQARQVAMPDNLIVRVALDSLPENVDECRGRAGFFLEYSARALDEIARIANRKYQTLSYFGFTANTLREFMENNLPSGIDRIVPIGQTTAFELVWDGYDLIATLSRVCRILAS